MMKASPKLVPPKHQRSIFSLCLMSFLAGVYLLTFRAFPVSLDEVALFSTTESLVKYREFNLVSLYHEYPVAGDLYLLETPWAQPVHEPLQTVLAMPLYWGAQHLPIGLMHTVWLFNILVTLGIALTLYHGGLSLGYGHAASWWTALLLGTCTMLLPYSQTFFREPLLTLLQLIVILLAFHLCRRWRWRLVAMMLILFGAAFLTKSVIVLALPCLIIVLFPDVQRFLGGSWVWRVIVIALVGIVVALVAGYMVSRILPNNYRFDYTDYEGRAEASSLAYARTVIGAYLFSPGRSLWSTSPLLVLAFYGAWLAFRQGSKRFALAPFVLLLSVTLGYSLGGWDWHGGRGWGTRYLLHVIPVIGLLLLPVLQAFFEGKIARKWQLVGGILISFSLLIQLIGVSVPIHIYYNILSEKFPNDPINAFYGRGTWEIQYTQWYLSLKALDFHHLEVAWSYAQPFWVGLLVGVLLMAASAVIFGFYRRGMGERGLAASAGALSLMVVFGYGVALGSLDQDKRILADRPELHQLLAAVDQQVQAYDIIFLSDPEYRDFFLNFYKGGARLVTLPYAPGERYSYEQIPQVVTDNPDERLDSQITFPLDYAAKHYDRLWLVTNLSQFQTWAYRPVEQYLTRHFYPVQEINLSADARLIEFSTIPAPAYDFDFKTLYITPRDPFQFGDHIVLEGYDVPAAAKVGSVLPISLEWERTGAVDFDYNVGVFLINQNGELVAARNGPPQGTFGFTSQWAADIPQGDNHGLRIPLNLPAGNYTVQVVMYDWRDAQRLPVSQDGQPIEGDFAEIEQVEIRSR